MSTPPQILLREQLREVHAIEAALVTNLVAHISMTPRGDYRSLLERHLAETKEQRSAVADRLSALGAAPGSRGIVGLAVGLAETAIGQALVLAKGPLDMVRGGTSRDEKLLKNARDEAASEALEIAAYDALERVAELAGDERTAELARRHREQEERMLAGLREQIPALATAITGQKATASPRAGRSNGDAAAAGRFTRSALPVANYDALSADAIIDQLDGLSEAELEMIANYEREQKNRRKVLTAITRAGKASAAR